MLACTPDPLPDLLAGIEGLVRRESPSADLTAVARSADVVTRVGERRLGVAAERIVLDGRTHLRWRLGAGISRVLLLGHHGTVWPLGSLATHPYVTGDEDRFAELPDAGRVRGAVRQERAGAGGRSARRRAEDRAQGISLYRVRATGRAAHAGLEPERGVNATVELDHQVLAVTALAYPDLGTTVTPNLLAAGNSTNTVPAGGEFAVDVRVRVAAEQERVDAAVRAPRPVSRGARLAAVGGGSDGNFTANVGTPTLDGLGAVGGGTHADDERVLPSRLALVRALIADLLSEGRRP